jgi:hypothetical protein
MNLQMSLVTTRMPATLIEDLKALACEEALRRGEAVSLGTLLREAARRLLKHTKRESGLSVPQQPISSALQI